jgi:hypothetical protein
MVMIEHAEKKLLSTIKNTDRSEKSFLNSARSNKMPI